jgi:nucleotide-binding universal stress UspA family protein
MYKTILVPTDGSELFRSAISEAAKLAKELRANLVLFYTAPHYHLSPVTEGGSALGRSDERAEAIQKSEAEAKKVLAAAASNPDLVGLNVQQHFAVSDSPYETILEAAQKFNANLIVMGSRRPGGLTGALLGSQTQKVLARANVPVLVIRF